MRWTSCLLALIFVAQVASCAVAPTLVLAPAVSVFGACDTWAEPDDVPDDLSLSSTFWCERPEQGDRSPSGWLITGALGVLLASVFAWLLPGAVLLARFQDKIVGDGARDPS